MARNEEKHVTRLNRLLLQQQREEEEKKNPKRPKLNTLNSSAEIQKWIPSIKKDIDFNLKQSQVACYPDRKIEEFSREIDKLKGEYHAFVRKLRQFDSSLKIVPWTERAYDVRKRPAPTSCVTLTNSVKTTRSDSSVEESPDLKVTGQPRSFRPLATPILDQEEKYGQLYGYQMEPVKSVWIPTTEMADQPLRFKAICETPSHAGLNPQATSTVEQINSEKFNASECLELKPNCRINFQKEHSYNTNPNFVTRLTDRCSAEVRPLRETHDLRTQNQIKLCGNLVAEYGGYSSDSEDSEVITPT